MEKLARYIIRASFSRERMTYSPEESKVVYGSKDGEEEKAFEALKCWPPCAPMYRTRKNRWRVERFQ